MCATHVSLSVLVGVWMCGYVQRDALWPTQHSPRPFPLTDTPHPTGELANWQGEANASELQERLQASAAAARLETEQVTQQLEQSKDEVAKLQAARRDLKRAVREQQERQKVELEAAIAEVRAQQEQRQQADAQVAEATATAAAEAAATRAKGELATAVAALKEVR